MSGALALFLTGASILWLSVRHVQRHDCGDCFKPYLAERRRLYRLRPGALVAFARRS
jgi:hypothetical protein